MNMKYLFCILITFSTLLVAQDIPLNDEWNTSNAIQTTPRVAKHPEGPLVCTWTDFRNNAAYSDIYMQFLSWKGSPIGGKLNRKVNDDSKLAPRMTPDVAMSGRGHAMIVWSDFRHNRWDVMGQYYLANGDTLGKNFRINDDTTTSSMPSIACGENGFVVVWSDLRNGHFDVYGQKYNVRGYPIDDNFIINIDTTGHQLMPRIAMNADGAFVVTWINQADGESHVYARIFNDEGQPYYSALQVTEDALNSSSTAYPNVAMMQNGTFMVVWHDTNEDGDYDIQARGYEANGATASSIFTVNERLGLENCKNPDIIASINQSFYIGWQSNRLANENIYYKPFGLNGLTGSSEYVATEAAGNQRTVAMVSDAYQNRIFVWMDDRNGNQDIYSQRVGLHFPNHAYAGSGFDSKIPIIWDPPFGYFQAETYEIYRKEGSEDAFELIHIVDTATRPAPLQMHDWIDMDVENGKTYTYRIFMDIEGTFGEFITYSATPSADGHQLFSKWTSKEIHIDGNIQEEEWQSAHMVNIQGSETDREVILLIQNDNNKLYLAIVDFNDFRIEQGNSLGMLFDTNHSGTWPIEEPGIEGAFLITQKNALFSQYTGAYPHDLTILNQGTPDGLDWNIGHHFGLTSYEISIDLTESPINASTGDTLGAALWVIDPGNFFNNPYGNTASWPDGALWEAAETLGDLILALPEDTIITAGWPMYGRTSTRNSWANIEESFHLYPPFDSTKQFLLEDLLISKVSYENDYLYICSSQAGSNPNMASKMNAKTGEILWQTEITNTIGAVGPQPTVSDSLVYYGGQLGDGLYAYDKETGQLQWIKDTGSLFSRHPILNEDRLYVHGDSAFCIEKNTGRTLWTFPKAVKFTPAIDKRFCYSMTQDSLYALDKYTGTLKWTVGNKLSSGFSVDDSRIYTFYEDSVVARRKSDGALIWGYPNPETDYTGYFRHLAVNDQIVCFTTPSDADNKGRLTVLDKSNGQFLWNHIFDTESVNNPTIANRVIYIVDWDPDLSDGILWGFDIENGKTVFHDNSADYRSHPIVADDRLFIGMQGGIKVFFDQLETDVKPEKKLARQFKLNQNYPNPFNPETKITYELSTLSDIHLRIYDILGREIKSWHAPAQSAGQQTWIWYGKNNIDHDVPSGLYFLQMRVQEKSGKNKTYNQTIKMIKLK